jgi:hypothetical protein
MEDGIWLNHDDKIKLDKLKVELEVLKAEHKRFTLKKSSLSQEEKDKWKKNSQRTTEVSLEIKELRRKNILDAGKV